MISLINSSARKGIRHMPQSLKILVVDDDVDNATSLGELFDLEGHQVHVVHSGEEAIRKSREEDFNISFMDVVMPGLNGVESFLQIRQLRPEASIYMMTGYSVEDLLSQALHGGALGVLVKPFDPVEVLQITAEIGPSGLVLAQPAGSAEADVGTFIRSTLLENGIACRHVTDETVLEPRMTVDEVLLLDMPRPLIDGIQTLKKAYAAGHKAATVLVPHARNAKYVPSRGLSDIAVTGILKKPFDPLELINRLPQLAA